MALTGVPEMVLTSEDNIPKEDLESIVLFMQMDRGDKKDIIRKMIKEFSNK